MFYKMEALLLLQHFFRHEKTVRTKHNILTHRKSHSVLQNGLIYTAEMTFPAWDIDVMQPTL